MWISIRLDILYLKIKSHFFADSKRHQFVKAPVKISKDKKKAKKSSKDKLKKAARRVLAAESLSSSDSD